ncbi:ras-related protein Rab-38 isoform X2 [Fundulus heteroclitus]|uniref:ras-related protein Rab-38 isoform X2 n=1 Tax=Fundulus heteroclitus TaxID=8078 RepID=UPI00165A6829|nr:ras-related protein Rab-38 isoform X2 [Fundulus heteroclitus]
MSLFAVSPSYSHQRFSISLSVCFLFCFFVHLAELLQACSRSFYSKSWLSGTWVSGKPLLSRGQERYGNMTRVYYREAVGALVVFDVTRASTFEAVLKWKDDLDSKLTLNHGRPVPVVLLANKSDQIACQLPKLDSFCKENGFVGWFETSAKENTHIEEAAHCLVEHILNNEESAVTEREPNSILLSGYTSTTSSHFKCSSCLK